MPPQRRVTKTQIINKTLDILKTESFDNINARRLAKELNCSVQPIFYNFLNMEELKKSVITEITSIYQNYMITGSKEEKSYKGMGLAYIKFARDYPNYFKILFMSETNLTPEHLIINDSEGNNVIREGMKITGFTYEEQTRFHIKVWIFTHGIATLLATKTVTMSDNEIEELLESSVREMIIGHMKGQK